MVDKKPLFVFTLFWLLFFSASCHQKKSISEKVTTMANLECRAIALRQQRFALANQIRFAQDTLRSHVSLADSIRLSNSLSVYNTQKTEILKESLILADTIHQQLDSLRKFYFTKEEDKSSFEKLLQEEITKRGCQEN